MLTENKQLRTILTGYIMLYCIIGIMEVFPRMKESVLSLRKIWKMGAVADEIVDYESRLLFVLNENKLLKSELHDATEGGTYSQRVSGVIAVLGTLQIKSGLDHLSVKPLEGYKKNELFILPFELSLQGSYAQVYKFVGMIEQSEFTVMTTKLQIHPVDAGSTIVHAKYYIDLYMNL
jgi:hypothetical protein